MTGRKPGSPDRDDTPGKVVARVGGEVTLHPVKLENAAQRRDRLAAQLRANLVKRKTQARARAQIDVAQDDLDKSSSTLSEVKGEPGLLKPDP